MPTSRSIVILIAVSLAWTLTPSAPGQCEVAVLLPSDGGEGGGFGTAVDIGGETAVIGGGGLAFAGDAAYVFRRAGMHWIEETRLIPWGGVGSSHFGRAVAIDGDVAVVGDSIDGQGGIGVGAAYAFRYDGAGWPQEARLRADDAQPFQSFGRAVAVSGERLVIAAPGDDSAGYDTGAVYVFDFDGAEWTQTIKLVASDGAAGDDFGEAVALQADLLLVGARHREAPGEGEGAVYVFRHNGGQWIEDAILTPDIAITQSSFGAAISVDDDVAVIGAPAYAPPGADPGAIFVFREANGVWAQEAVLSAIGNPAVGGLGGDVGVSGTRIVVGDSSDSFARGSVHVFELDGSSWTPKAKLRAAGTSDGDRLGFAVDVSGDTVLAGASKNDDLGLNSGAAFIFDAGSAVVDCNGNWVDDACDIFIGDSADCQGDGIPDECQPCAADVDCDGVIGFDDLLIVLSSWGPCVLWPPPFAATPGDTPEIEACGEDTNNGCFLDTPVFNPIRCGETISGTAWWDSALGFRDVDWYEVVVTEPISVTFTMTAMFESRIDRPSNGGLADCDFLCCPWQPVVGAPGETIHITAELSPGTHWFYVGSTFGADVLCGGAPDERYVVSLECTPEPIVTCAGDVDGDGVVGFGDVLAVLSSWGPCS